MSPKPWYSKGLRFGCRGSGHCCTSHGEYTYVYLTEAEVDALADHLGVSTAQFLARWCRSEDGWTLLRMDEPTCPFLTEERRCSVYPVRPVQCATWPFWRENLSRETWEGVVERICPGVGTGRLYTESEIERLADENEAAADG